MFKCGDTVLFGSQGVCKIKNIETREIDKTQREYYVLRPIRQENNTLFVPVYNESLVSKMYAVMSEEEVKELIKSLSKEDAVFETDDILRRNSYKEILSSGDRMAIAGVIKALFLEQRRRKEEGKKLPLADEQILNRAEALLHNEISYVLNINPDQVVPYIKEQVEVSALNR